MFQPYVWNRCNNLLIMSINLNDIVILNIRGIDYRCITNGISISDAVNVLQNLKRIKNLLSYIKWVNKLQHDVNIDRIVASNMVNFTKKGFKYLIGYKGTKKLDR